MGHGGGKAADTMDHDVGRRRDLCDYYPAKITPTRRPNALRKDLGPDPQISP